MPFEKGESGNAAGRPKGALNKTNKEIREAYQQLVELNLVNMTQWLGTIAEENPEKAMQLMLNLSEFIIPKLARTELTGQDGDDLFKNIKFEFGPDINNTTEREEE